MAAMIGTGLPRLMPRLGSAAAATLDAIAVGEITPGEGTAVAGLLDTKRRALETEDIENRITALEQN